MAFITKYLLLEDKEIRIGSTVLNCTNDGEPMSFHVPLIFIGGDDWQNDEGYIRNLPLWQEEYMQFSPNQFKADYQVGFRKESCIEANTPAVWRDKENPMIYWKWYETMSYLPEENTKDNFVGMQNSTKCAVPRNICIDITIVEFLCSNCKTFH